MSYDLKATIRNITGAARGADRRWRGELYHECAGEETAQVVWACSHEHDTPAGARGCAGAELALRKAIQVPVSNPSPLPELRIIAVPDGERGYGPIAVISHYSGPVPAVGQYIYHRAGSNVMSVKSVIYKLFNEDWTPALKPYIEVHV